MECVTHCVECICQTDNHGIYHATKLQSEFDQVIDDAFTEFMKHFAFQFEFGDAFSEEISPQLKEIINACKSEISKCKPIEIWILKLSLVKLVAPSGCLQVQSDT